MPVGELRRSARHDLRFRVVYDDGGSYSVGVVDDLSENGMLIETAELLPIGKIVVLEPVEAEEDELFELRAQVVRHLRPDELTRSVPGSEGIHGLSGMGLEFIGLGTSGHDRIQDLIGRLEASRRAVIPQGVAVAGGDATSNPPHRR